MHFHFFAKSRRLELRFNLSVENVSGSRLNFGRIPNDRFEPSDLSQCLQLGSVKLLTLVVGSGLITAASWSVLVVSFSRTLIGVIDTIMDE